MIFFCDVDGTIADCQHRRYLIPNWEAYHAKMADDTLNEPVASVVHQLRQFNKVMFVTGRPITYIDETLAWFHRNLSWPVVADDFLMRPAGDYTPNGLLKIRLIRDWWGPDAHFPMIAKLSIVLDDDSKVTATLRSRGFTVFQVGDGYIGKPVTHPGMPMSGPGAKTRETAMTDNPNPGPEETPPVNPNPDPAPTPEPEPSDPVKVEVEVPTGDGADAGKAE